MNHSPVRIPVIAAVIGFILTAMYQLLSMMSFKWVWSIVLGFFAAGVMLELLLRRSFNSVANRGVAELVNAIHRSPSGAQRIITIEYFSQFPPVIAEMAVRKAKEKNLIRATSLSTDIRYNLYELTDLGKSAALEAAKTPEDKKR